jgi:hypothetical protein
LDTGHWLAILIFVVLAGLAVYEICTLILDQTFTSKFMSKSSLITFVAAQCVLEIFLMLRLAFGSAANAFFAKPTPDE